MGVMLLCRNTRVREPYFVEEWGIHLYSGEELCYYIYHNAPLIEEDFLDERLFRFIGKELGMEGLERKLRKWREQADLPELLLVILQDVHYYDSEELFTFRENLAALMKKTPAQRMKDRADLLFKRRRYGGAQLQYDRLLHSASPELMNENFRGQVWLGRGMSFARQYAWQEAADCLCKAYALLHTDEIRKLLWQIRCLDEQVEIDGEAVGTPTAEEVELWRQEFNEAKEKAAGNGGGEEAARWFEKDKIRRAEGLNALVQDWKTQYRRSLGWP